MGRIGGLIIVPASPVLFYSCKISAFLRSLRYEIMEKIYNLLKNNPYLCITN